jgi:hypothetical protein
VTPPNAWRPHRETVARFGAALSDPQRVVILACLHVDGAGSPKSVAEALHIRSVRRVRRQFANLAACHMIKPADAPAGTDRAEKKWTVVPEVATALGALEDYVNLVRALDADAK